MLRVAPDMALQKEGTTEDDTSEPFHTSAPDGATAGLPYATHVLAAGDVNLIVQRESNVYTDPFLPRTAVGDPK
jgi:hypothetical protein